jgi:hypothetical protein
MIRGYAPIKGNVRRPRKAAVIYRRPELAIVFGALEANPGSTLFEGVVSDVTSPSIWQGGLLVKATFTADPQQQVTAPSMSDSQRLGLALLCYGHILPQLSHEAPAILRWQQWAQAWLDHRAEEFATDLTEMIDFEWPYPGYKYLAHAAYQIATGTVLRDRTSTMIIQAMTDLLRVMDQHALQIEEEVIVGFVQQSQTY